jgi:hypothetical protein
MKVIFKITYPNGKICVGKAEAEQATGPANKGWYFRVPAKIGTL